MLLIPFILHKETQNPLKNLYNESPLKLQL